MLRTNNPPRSRPSASERACVALSSIARSCFSVFDSESGLSCSSSRWIRSDDGLEKFFRQPSTGHEKASGWLCSCRWYSRCFCTLNALSQSGWGQRKGRSFECVRSCRASNARSTKPLPQSGTCAEGCEAVPFGVARVPDRSDYAGAGQRMHCLPGPCAGSRERWRNRRLPREERHTPGTPTASRRCGCGNVDPAPSAS